MTGARPLSLVAGAGICLGVALFALVSLVWTPHDPTAIVVEQRLLAPSAAHWFGTDHFGRDIFSMILVGAKSSIMVAAAAVAVGLGLGAPLGFLGAAAGGWIDEAVMRVNDLVFAFPALLLAILLSAALGPSALNAMIAIGVFSVPVFARVARAAALPLWRCDFVAAAQLAGKSRWAITWAHILPNAAAPLIVQVSLQFALAILAEAALAYVGLGAQPPQPSWGRMLAESQTFAALGAWQAIFPGLAIFLSVLGLNLLGDGLRDALDPKLAGRAS
ncbi:MAG: ABC transporter permease [Caulobacterales bacterium]